MNLPHKHDPTCHLCKGTGTVHDTSSRSDGMPCALCTIWPQGRSATVLVDELELKRLVDLAMLEGARGMADYLIERGVDPALCVSPEAASEDAFDGDGSGKVKAALDAILNASVARKVRGA